MTDSAWGEKETQYFFNLTPEKILDTVEAAGFQCTGRCLTLNSMENRVYEIELELDDPKSVPRYERSRIAKFYRPGRWTQSQILEEHQFLLDLVEAEIPVVAPLKFDDGSTLKQLSDAPIWYTLFPKVGGRSPDELSVDQLEQIGRLLARLHSVGAARQAPNRLKLTPVTYGKLNLSYLLESRSLPFNLEGRYQKTAEAICEIISPWFENLENQRIHGDCHLGNLLWSDSGPFWVDFDDMVTGPCVQDVWLITPGRDTEGKQDREILLEGYEQMRPFDRSSLKLIEPLRALRFIHFSAWIAKRWKDPAFPKYFQQFGTDRYWEEQLSDLEDQLRLIENS